MSLFYFSLVLIEKGLHRKDFSVSFRTYSEHLFCRTPVKDCFCSFNFVESKYLIIPWMHHTVEKSDICNVMTGL